MVPRTGGRSIRLAVKVTPSSPRDAIAGWLGDTLKVRVRAPAERGQADTAVEQVVAAALGVPVSGVRVVAGRVSRSKTLEVSGLTTHEVQRRIAAAEIDR